MDKTNQSWCSLDTSLRLAQLARCLLAVPRQADKADPNETVARLFEWEEKDDYGFFHDFERHAVEVLDKAGLCALEKAAQQRFEQALAETAHSGRRDEDEYPPYQVRNATVVLKTVLAAKADIDGLVSPG